MYGIRIRELRESKQFTQKELAQQLHSTQKQISKWETEWIEPNIYWLCSLACYFGVSIDYIVGLENEDGTRNAEIVNNCFANVSNSNIKF